FQRELIRASDRSAISLWLYVHYSSGSASLQLSRYVEQLTSASGGVRFRQLTSAPLGDESVELVGEAGLGAASSSVADALVVRAGNVVAIASVVGPSGATDGPLLRAILLPQVDRIRAGALSLRDENR